MKKIESKIKSSIIIEKEFQNLIFKLSGEERSGEAVPLSAIAIVGEY